MASQISRGMETISLKRAGVAPKNHIHSVCTLCDTMWAGALFAVLTGVLAVVIIVPVVVGTGDRSGCRIVLMMHYLVVAWVWSASQTLALYEDQNWDRARVSWLIGNCWWDCVWQSILRIILSTEPDNSSRLKPLNRIQQSWYEFSLEAISHGYTGLSKQGVTGFQMKTLKLSK